MNARRAAPAEEEKKFMHLSNYCVYHKKTARATETGFGPLHLRDEPMPVMNWDKLTSLVHRAGQDLAEIWDVVSAAYRSPEAARLLYDGAPHGRRARAPKRDFERMATCRFFSDSMEGVDPSSHTVLKFAQEERNGLPRRRIITWSKHNVECERQLLNCLKYDHLFFTAAACRDAGLKATIAAQLDCEKFYQQFELLVKSPWAVSAYGMTYHLRTIPTGSALAPILAQVLLHALARLAIADLEVTFDCCIDNLRFLGHDLEQVKAAWSTLEQLASSVDLVIGDMTSPSDGSYTYLGVFYDKDQNRARLKDSTALKLRNSVRNPNEPKSGEEHLSAFGRLIHAAALLRQDMSELFFIIKFIRRTQNKMKENDKDKHKAWPSIIAHWGYLARTYSTAWVTLPPAPKDEMVLFTDASKTGLCGRAAGRYNTHSRTASTSLRRKLFTKRSPGSEASYGPVTL